jgi:hypothetical protein
MAASISVSSPTTAVRRPMARSAATIATERVDDGHGGLSLARRNSLRRSESDDQLSNTHCNEQVNCDDGKLQKHTLFELREPIEAVYEVNAE